MNAKSFVSNKTLLDDLLGESDGEEEVHLLKNADYYIDKAQEILCDIDIDNYYVFLKNILVRFNDIDGDKKKELIAMLNIPVVTKIVYKTETKKKKKKKKLNMDDY